MKLALALPLALAAAFAATPAFAVPQINVTASETISTVPPGYKTTFTVQMVGYMPPGAYLGFHLESSGQGAPVTFYGTGKPGYPWSSQNTSALACYYVDGGGLQGLLQYSVKSDQNVLCVKFTLLNGLLSKNPNRNVQNSTLIKRAYARNGDSARL